ncbi:terpene synthase family protein [Chitinophaga nivalis]|uniref:Terpene synthase n=1 Tax=Chitinophaga nivalis TaxID=2991709 RepID=A0ABT3IWE9_9BACT|nr:hypothetical protein [Chitinophaga nivalis]MCW3462013.1 hypothetical protein [Chitinophaga nivalis]MCW3488295.1 hypothetical protein [Chitinophaga nivalis]
MRPLLKYPFPSRINPGVDLLEENAISIIEAYQLLPDAFNEKLKKINAGYWAAASWPNGTEEQLSVITRWLIWAITFDDYYGPLNLDDLSEACARSVEILRGAPITAHDNEIFRQLSLVREALQSFVTDQWMARFIDDHIHFFEGLMIDTNYSYKPVARYPSLEDYLEIRVKIMLAPGVADLIEVTTGSILPEDVYNHPYIRRISALAYDMMGWANDLYSLEKEILAHEVMNLVLVLQHTQNRSPEDAIQEAVRMHDAHLEKFTKLSHAIPDFGANQALVQKYVEGLGTWLNGHISWLSYTSRYLV